MVSGPVELKGRPIRLEMLKAVGIPESAFLSVEAVDESGRRICVLRYSSYWRTQANRRDDCAHMAIGKGALAPQASAPALTDLLIGPSGDVSALLGKTVIGKGTVDRPIRRVVFRITASLMPNAKTADAVVVKSAKVTRLSAWPVYASGKALPWVPDSD